MFPETVKHTLLKSIHLHSLNVICFVYVVVLDVKTALDNSKLAILERLELQIFCASSQQWWWDGGRRGYKLGNFLEEHFLVFCKKQNVIYAVCGEEIYMKRGFRNLHATMVFR